jgi:pimeloyl-ACP methyl ester carboxylesterase
MRAYIFKSATLVLLVLIAFGIVAGCKTVPTSASSEVSSKNIAYFFRPGAGPAVVFQSGLGDEKAVSARVIEQMPEPAAVFAYDRPGYGESTYTSEARDPSTIARELHELARKVGLTPPYVLVGHSLGGLYQYCYARLFSEEVAGLVLLDPTHPNHWAQMKKDAGFQAAIVKGLRVTLFSRAMRQEFDDQASCIESLDASQPLAVPTRLLFSDQFQLAEKGGFKNLIRELREQWLTLFSNAEASEVSGSGHYIQKEAPGEVVSTIQRVIATVRVSMPAIDNAINAASEKRGAQGAMLFVAGYGER